MQAVIGRIDGDRVLLYRLLRRPFILELRDIGAGHERLVAGAGHNDDADRIVATEIGEYFGNALPHIHRYGVEPLRIVEGHDADSAALLRDHLFGKYLGSSFRV